jgi:hypothetical protein
MKIIEEYIRLFKEDPEKAIEFSNNQKKRSRPEYSFRNHSNQNEWTDISHASGVRYVGCAMFHSSSSYSVNNTFPSSYVSMPFH